ncbi:hypothetical protein RHGRI_028721 [Rhododendron griersonianum]|uniref:Uncharacterized protein n=1 Tax=Rhododendron griersonianum TaxID=479676 RepID=A0AAV6IKA2_9ERIC|nr:hypothetical protein RHGRI_028721 [Rhododendron griersonianum]KAG5527884.1 hypothetical protein RHGRI_028721 [Rhododendron griersonianum]
MPPPPPPLSPLSSISFLFSDYKNLSFSLSPHLLYKPHQLLREYNHRVFRVFQTNRKADRKSENGRTENRVNQ